MSLIPASTCVAYTGVNIGIDTFCLEVCNITQEVCDTITAIIRVIPQTVDTDTARREILIGFADTLCFDSDDLIGEVDTIFNVCEDKSGAFV